MSRYCDHNGELGREVAVLAGQALLAAHGQDTLVLAISEQPVLKAALGKQADHSGSPSYVDCLVMALADAFATKYVFGFDETFRKNGYVLPGSQ